MAYYRSARDRFLATMADEMPATYPPADDLPRAGRALRRLPLGGRMRQATARRRPPEPRRRHQRPAAPGADRSRRRDARSPRRSAPADVAAARGRRRRGADPRSRAGADPARGATSRRSSLRALRARGRAADRSGARPGDPPRAFAWRPVLRHRGRSRTPSTTGSTTCSASWRPTAPFHAFWSKDDDGEFSPQANSAPSSS